MHLIVELFLDDCPGCNPVAQLVKLLAGSHCTIITHQLPQLDPSTPAGRRAHQLGVRTLPAVAVNGALVPGGPQGPTATHLAQAGVGPSPPPEHPPPSICGERC